MRPFSQMMVHAVASPSSSASLGICVSPPSGVIDAIDNGIRDALQRASHEFFWWVLISAFAVAIGVIMEGPEILHELWPRLFIWFTRPSERQAHKFERVAKLIAFWGWLLIGVGVVGEGVFEALQNRSEGQLQTFNDILLKDAKIAAGEAEDRAASANERAAANEKEAAQLRKDAEDERMERTKLDAQLRQRHLSKKQSDALINALKDSPSGGNAVVGTMPFDGEAKLYAQDFHDVLLQAGPKWNRDSRWIGVTVVDNFEIPGMPFDPWGITIRCRSAATCEAGQEMALAFKKAGFKEPPVVNVPSKYDCVVLLIGKMPTPNIDKVFKKQTIKPAKTIAKP